MEIVKVERVWTMDLHQLLLTFRPHNNNEEDFPLIGKLLYLGKSREYSLTGEVSLYSSSPVWIQLLCLG